MKESGYLLDTHSYLWFKTDDQRLSAKMRPMIEDRENNVYVSAVTCWEITTKFRLGKLPVPDHIAQEIEEGVLLSGLTPLAIRFAHAQRTGLLPPVHKDPFDRLLIAQALVEGLTLISRDSKFDQYGVQRVW